MASHSDAQARRVVVGHDSTGLSTVVEDGPTTTRLVGPGNTKCDIWRLDEVPAPHAPKDGLDGHVITEAPPNGLVVRVVTFPADHEWDRSVGYSDANGPLAGSVSVSDAGGVPGMHSTKSFDILAVISGELHVVLETGETLLRQGDTLVMPRGAKHAWSNKTDSAATVITLAVSTTP